MPTITSPSANLSLYMFSESHVVRTGIIEYYIPLLMSDMTVKTITQLTTINSTIPSTDPADNTFPKGINAATLNLTIQV